MKKLIYILIILLAVNIQAQNSEFKFKNLTTANGLSQMTVLAIHQDELGQMWFGTRNGLNKYDGTNFKTYRHSAIDSLSISNDDINSIEQDKDGYIWVGTYNGLNRYDPQTDIFRRYFKTNGSGSISNNTIWTIKEIKDEIWIGTSNGLNIYNKTTDKFTSFYHFEGNPSSIPGNFVFSILERSNGSIWVGTNKGLCKLISRKNGDFRFKQYRGISKNNNFVPELYVKDLVEGPNNNLWIATTSGGFYKYNKQSDRVISLLDIEEYSNLNTDSRTMCFDKQGNLWLGTYAGLSVLSPDGVLQTVSNHEGINADLNKLKTIFTDKKGSVWIGTYYGGIHLFDITYKNFYNINQNTYGQKLNYKAVGDFTKDQYENIYCGLEGGGITVLNNGTGSYTSIQKKEGGLSSNYVTSLCVTKSNDLWIGTAKSGLSLLNLTTQQFDNDEIPKKLQTLFKKAEGIYDIKESSDGYLWIGAFELGLIRYNRSDKTFDLVKDMGNSDKSLSSIRVKSVLIESKNRIWVGTQNGVNLLRVNKDSVDIEHFFFNDETNMGENVFALFKDSNNRIWVSLKSRGLFVFKDKSFKKVDLGIKNDKISTIFGILEDENKNLWMSSNQGILKFDPTNNTTILYSESNDLGINEFDANTCLKYSKNQFYFGGSEGIIYFNPENISTNTYAPKTLLTNFLVNNKSLLVNGEDGILNKSVSFTNKINLPYDKANFTINYAIPSFINSSKNHYAYRMIGLNKDWNYTSQTQANFTIQNPGTYYFEVKGANNDDVWNENSTKLEIVVLPAPWRSIWAYILYTIFIGSLLLLLTRFVKSKSKLKHELQLEQLEKQNKEKRHQEKLEFFTNISHEFKTPLTLILGPLQQLLLNYTGSSKMYKSLRVIEENGKHLSLLINRFIDFRKLENNQYSLMATKGDIVEFSRTIYLSFIEFAKEGAYNYEFKTSEEQIFIYYDPNKLSQVFYNLISNAFKYTPKGGNITFSIVKKKDMVVIDISDSGIGIDKKYIDKIFDRFFEVPNSNLVEGYNKGTGIGLSIAKNIVKIHKGSIHVKNKATNGVVFSVILPIGKEHLTDEELLDKTVSSINTFQQLQEMNNSPTTLQRDLFDTKKDIHIPTVLIVEDNKTLRLFIRDLLINDYNIEEAENGKIALEKISVVMPDLVISDIVMPVMLGNELCKRIKDNSKTSHIPVILLTSKTSKSSKLSGLECGADEYIGKPFDITELRLRIKNLLKLKQKIKDKHSEGIVLDSNSITVETHDEKLFKKAIEIIEDNISNNQFDITSFSTELGISRTKLFSKIKEWTKLTPNGFISDFRLKTAAQYLEQNKFNISEICYKVGFKNPKYFSKLFKEKYGVTPSTYKDKFSNIFE